MNKCESSDRAEAFIIDIEKECNTVLVSRDDLLLLFESCFQFNEEKIIDEIAFTGKYIHSLVTILKRRNDHLDEVALLKVKEEYTANIKRFTELIEKIINPADDIAKEKIQSKYLQLSHQALENISILCSDLNFVKIYLNDKKYLGSN